MGGDEVFHHVVETSYRWLEELSKASGQEQAICVLERRVDCKRWSMSFILRHPLKHYAWVNIHPKRIWRRSSSKNRLVNWLFRPLKNKPKTVQRAWPECFIFRKVRLPRKKMERWECTIKVRNKISQIWFWTIGTRTKWFDEKIRGRPTIRAW